MEDHPSASGAALAPRARSWAGYVGTVVVAALLAVVAVRLAPSSASADPERPGLANPIEQRQAMIEELRAANARLERMEKSLKALERGE